ncbi:MAG: hypothetical protein ACREX3_00345 [Gammaproteobacteria bacterium]
MFWIGVLIISPLWGLVSTQLFLQACLSFASLVLSAVGLVRGRVPRRDTLMQIGVNVFSILLWSGLLRLGFWLIVDVLHFGSTSAENIVYWIFAALSAAFMLPQIPGKLRRSWHFAMTPQYLNQENIDRGAA